MPGKRMNPNNLSDSGELIIWSMMIGTGLITFAIRFAPIALLSRLELPDWLKRALRYVPPAVMTAIITPTLFFTGGAPTISLDYPRLSAAIFAVLIAWRTRSTLWTVVWGMLVLWGLQALMR
jgi:branched-subunit amino acid transport protein